MSVPTRPVRPFRPSPSPGGRPRRAPVLWAGLAVGLLAAVATALPSAGAGGIGATADLPPARMAGYWFGLANGDTIRALLREDRTLWSATDGGGVVRWDLADGTFHQSLAPQSGLPANDVRALLRDRRGTLWAGTAAGLARLDEATGRWRVVPVDGTRIESASVTALADATDGALWVGFEQAWDPEAPHPAFEGETGAFVGGGLARLEPGGGWGPVVGVADNDDPDARVPGLPSANVTALAFDGDGRLWVGTRPAFAWREDACGRPSCPPDEAAWVEGGGGLAASDDLARGWRHWTRSTDEFCLASTNHVSDLGVDAAGRVWVATRGRGLQAFLQGLDVDLCKPDTGHRHYERARDGLPANHLWSLEIDAKGRVLVGVGDGERGLGVSRLDHQGTLEDPTQPGSDDVWETVGLDGYTGQVDAVVTAIDVSADGTEIALGTRDDRSGDGWGIKRHPYEVEAATPGAWSTLATASTGLPSNQVTAIAADPRTGDVWIGSRARGVAVWNGTRVRRHEAFAPGEAVGALAAEAPRGAERVTVTVRAADLGAALGEAPRLVRWGTDRGLYEVGPPQARPGGLVSLDVRPPLAHGFPTGTELFAAEPGPAGDAVTAIAFDEAGRAWVGARKTLLRPARPGGSERYCETYPDCWYDGGLAVWDGATWRIERPPVGADGDPARDVLSLVLDARGRLWAGTGDPGADDGDGVLVLDPASGEWSNLRRDTVGPAFGGDVVTGLTLDVLTGHVWLATHHGRCVAGSVTDDCPQSGRIGGGVSRFDGTAWSRWSTGSGSSLLASGAEGNFTAILFDPGRGGVWAGAWAEGSSSAHWLTGVGIDAAASACPRNCTDGAWASERFRDDGAVRALARDAAGNVWLGASRDNRGAIPHAGGVKILGPDGWSRQDTGAWSVEITALGRQGDGMWVGTFDGGAARWWPVELAPGAYLPVARR